MSNASSGFLLIAVSLLLLSTPLQARQNILGGGIVTGIDFSDTQYRGEELTENSSSKDVSKQKLSIGPILNFSSKSRTDSLTIRYNPSYAYDLKLSDSNWEHDFSLLAGRTLSKTFSVSLKEKFLYTDDPNLIDAGNSQSYQGDRRRYWTNNLSVTTTYNYGQERTVATGYHNSMLRNDYTGVGGYEDYDRHMVDLSLHHRFSTFWSMSLTTSYTRGLFDPPDPLVVETLSDGLETLSPGITESGDTRNLSDDLSEYRADMSLKHLFSRQKSILLQYDFSRTAYDAILRNDTDLHNLSIAVDYQYTKRLALSFGGGPSYEDTETYAPNWNYNAHLGLKYELTRQSQLSTDIKKGYEQENFSFNNTTYGRDQGLTEFWDVNLVLLHNLLRNLRARFFISYRDESQENLLYGVSSVTETDTAIQDTDRETLRKESIFSRDIYQTGARLRYTFRRFWTATVSYSYRKQDSELINDSYDEHRVYLTLAVEKEFLRW